MKLPWRRKPLPAIPPYQPVEVKPVVKEEPSVIVEEVDTSDMTKTGVFRAWQDKAKKRIKGE